MPPLVRLLFSATHLLVFFWGGSRPSGRVVGSVVSLWVASCLSPCILPANGVSFPLQYPPLHCVSCAPLTLASPGYCVLVVHYRADPPCPVDLFLLSCVHLFRRWGVAAHSPGSLRHVLVALPLAAACWISGVCLRVLPGFPCGAVACALLFVPFRFWASFALFFAPSGTFGRLCFTACLCLWLQLHLLILFLAASSCLPPALALASALVRPRVLCFFYAPAPPAQFLRVPLRGRARPARLIARRTSFLGLGHRVAVVL